jgi:hypothetical protein
MAPFVFEDPTHERAGRALLRRLPALYGARIVIGTADGLRDRHGPVHAGSFLRERRIVFDCPRSEFPRIFCHELFHFVWLRAGNGLRREYERLLEDENAAGGRGELGWSAEWRKVMLTAGDVRTRSRRWREYCCESFCDTAAWLYSGTGRHREFTLADSYCGRRRTWFRRKIESRALSI